MYSMCAMPFNRKYSPTAVVSPRTTEGAASVLSKTEKKNKFLHLYNLDTL